MDLPQRRASKKQGIGSRKGNTVHVGKWAHPSYSYAARWIEGGKKKVKGFKKKKDAESFAEEKELELREFGSNSEISFEERSAVIQTRARLAAAGISLHQAIEKGCQVYERDAESISVSEFCQVVRADLIETGRSDRYLQDWDYQITRGFVPEFGDRLIHTITSEDLAEWLKKLKKAGRGPVSRNNSIRMVKVMFNRAIPNYIDDNPASYISKAKVVSEEVGVLLPEQLRNFIAKSPADLLPVILIGAFAGVRRSEIESLQWSEIHEETGVIEIKAENAKSSKNRLIPIEDNLSEWLKVIDRGKKPWPLNGAKKLTKLIDEVFGDDYPSNALRHSYGSYHLARDKNAAELALNMGHSTTKMIFDHYRKPIAGSDVSEYWDIRPKV